MLFAEGITHSGRQLLPFFRGAFEGGSPVQPVVLRYPYTYHNAAAWTRPFLDSLERANPNPNPQPNPNPNPNLTLPSPSPNTLILT